MTQPGQPATRTQRRSDQRSPSSSRAGGRGAHADGRSLTDAMGAEARGQTPSSSAPSLKADEPVVTAGRNGERNLSVLWVDVWIGNSKPCRFDVTTLPGHTLQVVVEQAAYRRVYDGTGTVSTQPVPVAPRGTTLKVTATDLTTGETVEQNGVWYDHGGTSLWQLLKRLIWKG